MRAAVAPPDKFNIIQSIVKTQPQPGPVAQDDTAFKYLYFILFPERIVTDHFPLRIQLQAPNPGMTACLPPEFPQCIRYPGNANDHDHFKRGVQMADDGKAQQQQQPATQHHEVARAGSRDEFNGASAR